MSFPRFYCAEPLAPETTLPLPEALAHYAVRVLRLKDRSSIVLFDGRGGEYPAVLEVQGKRAQAHTGAHDPREAELAGEITLVQGLPSGDKMDWIVEKAVELGVHRIVPIAADRSVLQLTGERREKRLAHWRRVVESAAEQCGRNRLLSIDAPMTLEKWLATPVAGLRLMCHPAAQADLAQALVPTPTRVTLIVGPEGGWSDAELAHAGIAANQVRSVRWGQRVMRTETAGLALTAATTTLLQWI